MEQKFAACEKKKVNKKLSRSRLTKLDLHESFEHTEQTTLSDDTLSDSKHSYQWTTTVLKNNVRENLLKPIRRLWRNGKLLSSMEEGIDIDFSKCSEAELNHLFLWAAFLGNIKYAEDLLKLGADVAATSETEGLNALHVAALNELWHFCSWLLRNGCPITETADELTPMHFAVLGGSLELVKHFISYGCLIPDTVINSAVYAGALDCIRYLLPLVNDVNAYQDNIAPLHVAADLGNVLCMKELLVHPKIDVNLKTSTKGYTALHISAENGYAECVELLIKYGAKVNELNCKQQTPLHLACKMKYLDCVNVLLENYASVNVADTDSKTPLHLAITKGVNALPIVEKLVEWDADINAVDKSRLSPLHLAAMNELQDCANCLIRNGANLMLQTEAGLSALSLVQREIPASLRAIRDRLTQSLAFNKEQNLKFSFRELLMYSSPGEINYLHTLSTIGENEILKHPLCRAFLYLKWQKIRPFYFIRLLCILILVFLISTYVIIHSQTLTTRTLDENLVCKYNGVNFSLNDQNQSQPNESNSWKIDNFRIDGSLRMANFKSNGSLKTVEISLLYKCSDNNRDILFFDYLFLKYPVLGFTLVNIILLFLRVSADRSFKKYVKGFYYILEFLTVLSTCLLFILFENSITEWVKILSPVVVLLNWIHLTICIGQLPLFGVHITMFKKVFQEFIKLIFTYLCLLIGFTCTFCVLFPKNFFFANPIMGFVKIIMMMTGEIDMKDSLSEEGLEGYLRYVAFIIIMGFVILVTVVLMNLLIGIAVQDVEGLRKNADLAKLKQQTELIHSIELVCFYKHLPKSVSKWISKFLMISPNLYRVVIYVRPMHPRENKLPKDIMDEALILAMSKKKRVNGDKSDEIRERFDYIDEKLAKLEGMLASR